MLYLISLAWKNLSRYKKRTMITASAIAFGLGIFIFVDSMLIGANMESIRNILWYESGSGKIVAKGYWDEKDKLPLTPEIADPSELLASLKNAGIQAVPRITFAGDLYVAKDPYPEEGSLAVRILAIDPAVDGKVYRFEETLSAGEYLTPGTDGAVIGSWLAEDIGAKVGYPITIVTRTKDGAFQTFDMDIVGIVDCPNPNVNRRTIIIPIGLAQTYLDMGTAVNDVDFIMNENASEQSIMKKVSAALPAGSSYEIYPWHVVAADFLALTQAKGGGSKMIIMLVFIIAAVGISNTVLMTVFERIREIGMMRSLGFRDRDIKILLVLEGCGIGLIGSILGVIIGTIFNYFLIVYGIDFSFITRSMDIGYRIGGVLKGAWIPSSYITALLTGVLLSGFVAWIPARKATQIGITDCLRYQ